jgi:hypothetical protein
MLCESEEIRPGERAHIVFALKRGTIVRRVDLDPPSAVAFQNSELRVDSLTPGEMHVLTGIEAPGVLITVRNESPKAHRFRAQIEALPDLAVVELQLGRVVERDWESAYLRAIRRRTN